MYDVLSTSWLLHSSPASALEQGNIISGGSRQKPPHQSPAPSVLPASRPPRCSQELCLHLKSDHVLLCSKPLLTAFQSHSSSSGACAICNLAPGLSTFLPFCPSLAPLHRTSSLLLLGPISYALTSRPLHGLFHLPGMLFPPTTTWPTPFTSSLSLFKSRSSVRPLSPCFPSQSLFPGSPAWSPARICLPYWIIHLFTPITYCLSLSALMQAQQALTDIC